MKQNAARRMGPSSRFAKCQMRETVGSSRLALRTHTTRPRHTARRATRKDMGSYSKSFCTTLLTLFPLRGPLIVRSFPRRRPEQRPTTTSTTPFISIPSVPFLAWAGTSIPRREMTFASFASCLVELGRGVQLALWIHPASVVAGRQYSSGN